MSNPYDPVESDLRAQLVAARIALHEARIKSEQWQHLAQANFNAMAREFLKGTFNDQGELLRLMHENQIALTSDKASTAHDEQR